MKAAPFELARPGTLEEALGLLASPDRDAKVLAGGQSLVPILAFRLARPALLVDIGRIEGLDRIDIGADGVRLGARVRWRDIERDMRLETAHPLLKAAVTHIAHYQIRNRGTVGGSLAHADPAAELPGVAVACDAVITVHSAKGRRKLPAKDFFIGPLTTALEPDEIITELHLPAWSPGRRFGFDELARRKGDFALAGVALHYDLDSSGRCREPHVAVIGAGDHAQRVAAAEAVLDGQTLDAPLAARAAAAGAAALDPPGDLHAPADYRRALAEVLMERTLLSAAGLPAN